MKKSLLLIIVVAGLLAGFGLEARRGGGRRGGHRGGRHHGRRHGGWGRRGWGGVGFGLRIGGGPGYYADPLALYWRENPYETPYDEYVNWLRAKYGDDWRRYSGRDYRRRFRSHRWRARPRVGFGIGVGF